MENQNQKKYCSFQGHEKIYAVIFCNNCKIYMCNKCEAFHSKLLQNHQIYNIEKINSGEIINDYCQENNHNIELQYYCKNHNQLCCAKCITKIKDKGNGLHKDCDIYTIEDIKNEKMNQLNNNIKNLELLSKNLQESINKLKNIFENITKNKEEIQTKIQKIFTKIRNELNKREDFLIQQVEEIFNNNYFNEELIKQGEKLPNRINISLEKCKLMNNNKEDNNLVCLINNCMNIENNLNEINKLKDSINKNNNLENSKIIFFPNEEEKKEELNYLIETIKNFGKICKKSDFCIPSSIINNDINKQNLIVKWIEEKINKKNIQFELIFKMSIHGYNCEDFHKKCDNKGETLILIKINENLIIGGYTSLNWDSSSKWKKDNNTFIFSLTHNKKYIKNNDNSNSIYCLNSFGPMFDNLGFDENKSMKEFKFNPQNSFLYSYEIFPDNKNEIFCEVKEVEIYSLMIQNNYIISQYNIKSDKKGESVKIINSCFGEINELSCDLYLNNKKINFDFDYLFNKEGEYTFKIIFKILLKDMSYIFSRCSSLTSLNLFNFNINNVNYMNGIKIFNSIFSF